MPTLLQVREVMSTPVVTVTRLTSFKDLAEVLASRHINTLPVLDNQERIIGVVSQADLLPKEAFRDHRPSRREQLLHLEELEKACGVSAGDIMSSPAIVIGPDASLSEAARLMARHHVRSLPVVDEKGHPVGIVSRGDLLKVFLISDAQLHDTIVAELALALHDTDTTHLTVSVTDAVVSIGGTLPETRLLPLLARVVRGVEGVVDVHMHLDQYRHRTPQPPEFKALY